MVLEFEVTRVGLLIRHVNPMLSSVYKLSEIGKDMCWGFKPRFVLPKIYALFLFD